MIFKRAEKNLNKFIKNLFTFKLSKLIICSYYPKKCAIKIQILEIVSIYFKIEFADYIKQ